MKKFFLYFSLTLVVLLGVIFMISYFFNFLFSNVAFITSIIACFITYSGGSSKFGEANVAINTQGNYVPSSTEKIISAINPFFVASCLILLGCLASYPFFL